MPRRALVLSGGGAKGSFQLGVLEELILNRGLDFQIFCGTSVGALNASFLAQARFDERPRESLNRLKVAFRSLRRIWLEHITGNHSVYRERPLGIGGIVGGADSLYDPEPLADLLNRYLRPQALAQSQRLLKIQYVVLETGELRTVDSHDPHIVQHVLASATMPFFFPPVQLQGEHLVDGGLRDVTPLGAAFQADPPPDEIYVIYASPFFLEPAEFSDPWPGLRVSALDYLARGVEILSEEVYQTDIRGALRFNSLKKHWEQIKSLLPAEHPSVQEIDRVLQPLRYAEILEVQPEQYIIRNALNFSPVKIRENYEHGKAVARNLQLPGLPVA
jgi:NTE family protein